MQNRIKYIFIADGDFKVFLSELIAKQYCTDGEHHLITFTPRIQETWDLYDWHSKTLLPWSHKQGLYKKYLHIRSRIHQILKHFTEICEGADEIYVHAYQIYSERTNYIINHLRKNFTSAKLRFRLIPDGTLNMQIRPSSGIRRIPQFINKLKWLHDPSINYYMYKGDRLGAEADITDRIYLPSGFPNEYDQEKIFWINIVGKSREKPKEKRALVVGTALIQTKACTTQQMELCSIKIWEYLETLGFRNIHYKPHHKEPLDNLNIYHEGYKILETKRGVERIILDEYYDHVISVCSTALITSKLIFSSLDVTSVGQDLIEKHVRKSASIHKYRSACEHLGINFINVL
jgi:hypothetical protein